MEKTTGEQRSGAGRDGATVGAVPGILAKVARPRLTGSSGAAEVGGWLRSRFEDLGYQVKELPFEFSALPGRFGVPVVGGLLIAAALVASGFLWAAHPLVSLLVLLGVGALVVTALFLAPRLIDGLPWERLQSANWLVTRPGVRPHYLVAAHRDSKSQPVSIRLRAAGVVAAALGWLGLVVLSVVALAGGPIDGFIVILAAVVALGGATLLALSWADNHSPGALDNATGIAALLRLAETLPPEDGVGFLVTDGEEMGMAGALAVRGALPPVAGIINLDGLDDEGPLQIVERFGFPRRGRAAHLTAALLRAADELGMEARRRDLPPGILLESVAYTWAGIPSLTLLRGRTTALSRVHRPADKPERLTGEGVVATVKVVTAALRNLHAAASPPSPEPLLGRRRPAEPSAYFPRVDVENTPLLREREGEESAPLVRDLEEIEKRRLSEDRRAEERRMPARPEGERGISRPIDTEPR